MRLYFYIFIFFGLVLVEEERRRTTTRGKMQISLGGHLYCRNKPLAGISCMQMKIRFQVVGESCCCCVIEGRGGEERGRRGEREE